MAFRLTLDQDVVPVEPGATAPLTVVVTGDPASSDRYELEVEGVDPEWKAIPVPVFGTEPGETRSEKLFFKPPRASESGAGNYPFVVRVRSLETGESRTAQGILQVTAFNHLGAELSPKKGYFSPLRHQNEFDIALVNLGNRTLPVQLTASDPEDACAYVFEQDHVEIGPGQQKDLTVRVNPRRNPFLASGRLIGFTVTARATDTNNVATQAQAQLEQRAFLSPLTLVFLLFLAALTGGWWISRPQKPTVSLYAEKGQFIQGESIDLSWQASPGSMVHIESDKGDVVYDGNTSTGKRSYKIDRSGTLVFTATASRDGLKADPTAFTVTVTAPEVTPSPVIRSFSADPPRVRLGQPVTLRYEFSDSVTEARLAPTNEPLDPALTSFQVVPQTLGKTVYEIVARNKDGKETTRKLTVETYDQSDAQIFLKADPVKVPYAGDMTTISWQTVKAIRVELKIGSDQPQQVTTEGTQQIAIGAKTRIVLIAYDAAKPQELLLQI
ncbi:hypothetical protein EON81_22170, partial [bacterium]